MSMKQNPKQTLHHPFCPGCLSVCLMFSASIVLSSRLLKGCSENKKNTTDLNVYQSLLSSLSANVSTAKKTYYHNKINNSSNSRMLFKTFSSLLCPPPPPPSSALTADDFAMFFMNKIKTISAQFSTPKSVKHILPANIHSFTSFSSLSETEVSELILSNHPTTCTLDSIPFPAVVPALTHIINTYLHTGVFPSAFRQACVTPLHKKSPLTHLF